MANHNMVRLIPIGSIRRRWCHCIVPVTGARIRSIASQKGTSGKSNLAAACVAEEGTAFVAALSATVRRA